MRIKEQKVYGFGELSERAKNKAREWFRGVYDREDWADCVLEQANDAAAMLGIEIGTRVIQLYGGGTRLDPVIYWSIGGSDAGVAFNGRYKYAKGSVARIKREWPKDTKLHEIARGLQAVQQRSRYAIKADICTAGGRVYNGLRFEDISNIPDSDFKPAEGGFDDVCHWIERFADWIRLGLEKEWDWINSDEQVDESIMANEYEFDVDGRIA